VPPWPTTPPNGTKRVNQSNRLLTHTGAATVLCTGWWYRPACVCVPGGQGLYWCAEALFDELGVPYIPLPGTMRIGPMGPVILYNPTVLTARNWWDHAVGRIRCGMLQDF
jgi:hypothetical protein